MSHTIPSRDRSFGLSVGSVLCAGAALMAWRGRIARAEAFAIVGGLLMAAALIKPTWLRRPSDLWWHLARVLAYVNARVILTILFAVAFVPLGLVWRVTGKDPLARRRDMWPGWSPHPKRYRDPKHYARMF